MNKEDLIKSLVSLDMEELLNIAKYIHNLECMTNKSEKDNLIIRYLAFRGYHSFQEFYDKLKIHKDSAIGHALKGKNDSIKSLLELKNMLNIPDDVFLEYVNDLVKEEENEKNRT